MESSLSRIPISFFISFLLAPLSAKPKYQHFHPREILYTWRQLQVYSGRETTLEESSTYPASSYAREPSNSGRGTKQSFPRCRSPAAIYLNDLKPSCSSHLFAAWKRNSSKGMQRRNICLPVLFRCLGPTALGVLPAREEIYTA